jgi:hypothetical protein
VYSQSSADVIMAFNLSFSAPAEIKEKERKDENVMSMRK